MNINLFEMIQTVTVDWQMPITCNVSPFYSVELVLDNYAYYIIWNTNYTCLLGCILALAVY